MAAMLALGTTCRSIQRSYKESVSWLDWDRTLLSGLDDVAAYSVSYFGEFYVSEYGCSQEGPTGRWARCWLPSPVGRQEVMCFMSSL